MVNIQNRSTPAGPRIKRVAAALASCAIGFCSIVAAANAKQKRGVTEDDFDGDHADQVTVSSIIPLISAGEISGSSNLIRTKDGVGFNFNTADLEADAPYTMWWVTFNRPKKCLSACECGLADLGDPAVDAGVFFAGGRMSDQAGQANFAGEIAYGELPPGEDQIPFPGIEAPIGPGSEVHLVVRAHGDALSDPDALKAQLTQFNGGCAPNSCVDVQASIHRSQLCRKRSRR